MPQEAAPIAPRRTEGFGARNGRIVRSSRTLPESIQRLQAHERRARTRCQAASRPRSWRWMPCDLHSRSPTVTARAHRGPAVSDAVRTGQGPGSRAWKARPGTPLSRDATPMAQVKALLERPLLSVGTVRDRCYGHAEGTAGEDHAGSGVAAVVTSCTEGEARPRRPPASLASRRRGAAVEQQKSSQPIPSWSRCLERG
jgi:hypothetical protein